MAVLDGHVHAEKDDAAAAARQDQQPEKAAMERDGEQLDVKVRRCVVLPGGTKECQEYDPTTNVGRSLLSRYSPSDLSRFDLEEESTVGPMRHAYIDEPELVDSVNMLSIKVLEADDVEFPINVYGTVLARDDLDRKCVYLFRRDRDNPQLIKSHNETLALTGPSRGLVVFDVLFFEINLKIRGKQQIDDRDLSKGVLDFNVVNSTDTIISDELTSWLSTVELTYAHVERAVEATVEITFVNLPNNSNSVQASTEKGYLSLNEKKGTADFYGKITACTSGIPDYMVLYDSEVPSTAVTAVHDGYFELCRRVIAVPIGEMLLLRIGVWDDGCGAKPPICTINFTPKVYGGEVRHVRCASYEMQVKVAWSALYISKFDSKLRKPEAY